MAVRKGDKAPDFTLKNTTGENVQLSNFKNNAQVVILFFPLAFTSTCTEELCTVRDNRKLYRELDGEILALSVDSHFVLKEFKKAQNLNFTLLSDFNKEVSKKYGVLYDDFYGMKEVSKRSAFVIDREGIVKHSQILEDAGNIPDFDSIIRALQ